MARQKPGRAARVRASPRRYAGHHFPTETSPVQAVGGGAERVGGAQAFGAGLRQQVAVVGQRHQHEVAAQHILPLKRGGLGRASGPDVHLPHAAQVFHRDQPARPQKTGLESALTSTTILV